MEDNRPRGREKNVTGPGKTVQKRGEGLGGGGHRGFESPRSDGMGGDDE